MNGARIVCVGGMDPSGGAGLVRDAWTLNQIDAAEQAARTKLAQGGRALVIDERFVVSCWTMQRRGATTRAWPVRPENFRAALECAGVGAHECFVKVGLIDDRLLALLLNWLRQRRVSAMVLDPILYASDGAKIGASAQSLDELAGQATLVTPNVAEAKTLGWDQAALGGVGSTAAVLLKGIDERPDQATEGIVCDRLITRDRTMHEFRRARQSGPDPRGTGCTLSTAIVARLARGDDLVRACQWAISWLDARRSTWRRGPDGRAHLA